MRRVIAYSDLEHLRDPYISDMIRTHPIVTASPSMGRGMNRMMGQDLSFEALGFRDLFKDICGTWDTGHSKISRRALATRLFHELMEGCEDDERDRLDICRRNRFQMVDGIELLSESGLSYDDLDGIDMTPDIRLFRGLWEFISKNDPSQRELDTSINAIKDRDHADRLIGTSFRGFDPIKDGRMIMAQGFYFVTPLEDRVFSALESAGYEIVMLANYDERYDFANRIWTSTFAEDMGYQPKGDWVRTGCSDNTLGDALLNRTSSNDGDVTYKEYGSVVDFIRGIKDDVDDRVRIFSPDQKTSNDILKEYFPEHFEKRRLLAYPIGQFICILHRMWDDNIGGLRLRSDDVCECFSTGWLSSNGYNSRGLLLDLTRMLPYFSDCETLEQWSERISRIRTIMDTVVRRFEVFDEDDRWGNIMSNPFPLIGAFAARPDRLEAIIGIIERLMHIARTLFNDDADVSISEHMDRLRHLIDDGPTDGILEEEKEVMNAILAKMTSPNDDELRFMPGDLKDAILYYLSDSLDNGLRDEEHGLVRPLSQIDAAAMNGSGRIHLILCDMDRLPGKDKHFEWPLSETLVDRLCENMDDERRRYLRILKHVISSSVESNRYCLYSAFENNDIRISWIHEMGGKMFQPTPYIRLLELTDNIHKDTSTDDKKRIIERDRTPAIDEDDLAPDVGRGRPLAKEVMMEYCICPLKYLYGYVLDNRPTYSSEFMWNFVISGLANAVEWVSHGDSRSYEQVMSLFPGLLEVERRDIWDKRRRETVEENGTHGGYRMTSQRFIVEFPNPSIMNMANNLYIETKGGRDREFKLDEPSTIKKACTFCPHTDYCRRAIFALDQEAYYGDR